jgi:hypothetical protein
MRPIKPALLASATLITLLSLFPVTVQAAPDAAKVYGDLRVDGIVFNKDNSNMQTKASPWGYGALNGVDIGILYKVGIGKLVPDFTLDVAGDAQVSGNLILPSTTPSTGIIKSGPDTLLHTSGTNNLFLGKGAGTLTTSGQGGNTASGAYALSGISSAFNNTAIGYGASMFSTAGSGNTAVGMWSLRDNQGSSNTGVGEVTLFKNSGQGNTAIGDAALLYNTSGQFNTAVGYYAGNTNTVANANFTGSNNTFIGYNSGPGTTTQLTNATAIGANALVSQSNSLILGAPGVNVGIGTTTPGSSLTVAGFIESTSGGVKFSDGMIQTTAKTDCMGRYEDNGNGTVSDCRTGLIWLKDANCLDTSGGLTKISGALNWFDAGAWTAGLGSSPTSLCGLTDGSTAGDWRLPTKTEWMAMIASAKKQGFTLPALSNRAGTGKWTAGDLFNNVQSDHYWSGSTLSSSPAEAWVVNVYNGALLFSTKIISISFVWPVRAGQ